MNKPNLPSRSLLLPLQIAGMNLSLCTALGQSKDMRINMLHLDDHIEFLTECLLSNKIIFHFFIFKLIWQLCEKE